MPPDLAELVATWPALPDYYKTPVLAVIRSVLDANRVGKKAA